LKAINVTYNILTDSVLSQPISLDMGTAHSGITVRHEYRVAHPANKPITHCFFSGLKEYNHNQNESNSKQHTTKSKFKHRKHQIKRVNIALNHSPKVTE